MSSGMSASPDIPAIPDSEPSDRPPAPPLVYRTVADVFVAGPPAMAPLVLPRRRILLPATLFVATVASTFWAGSTLWLPIVHMDSFDAAGQALAENWREGALYAVAVLGILVSHEMGHFLTALAHRIPTSLPYFIPLPLTPFGTMGAVISMRGSRADRRQMFDLGIAGPLAGLAVAIPITCLGVQRLGPPAGFGLDIAFHNPLILTLLTRWLRPDVATDSVIYLSQLNPWLMAGWVGMFVTGLNMLPVSQLDGGHVSYALLGRRAHTLARTLLIVAILYIIVDEKYIWVLMVVLVTVMGTDHPPTANDHARLGPVRYVLGWAAMTVPILCFSPRGVSEVIW
jgi:membrane-associated protease RseP (regulator of RpoE activity)